LVDDHPLDDGPVNAPSLGTIGRGSDVLETMIDDGLG